MAEPMPAELGKVEKRLSRWRQRHGGRGRPIPQELWVAAAEAAALAGVGTTARVLGVDRARLQSFVQGVGKAALAPSVPSRAFVELDAQRVLSRAKVVLRLTSRDGEQLEVEVEGGEVDVAALASSLWNRAR